jgi:hypothetical protein
MMVVVFFGGMDASVFRKCYESASDLGGLAARLAESGMKSVMEVVRGVRIFGSLSAMSDGAAERDETHYLLVPRLGGGGFSVFRKRVLPEGVGAENGSVKARIFHVPDASARGVLESELARVLAEELPATAGVVGDLADMLDRAADEIDRETSRVSGGLLIIGGVVALVNPLVGVGIAAKSLLPSLGAKATKMGADFVGGKLRDWGRVRGDAKRLADASREVRRLKPEVFENPLLRTLGVVVAYPEGDEEPFLDRRNWPDSFPRPRYHAVTVEALAEVLGEEDLGVVKLGAAQRRWVEEMRKRN